MWGIDNFKTNDKIREINNIVSISSVEDPINTEVIDDNNYKFIDVNFDKLINLNDEVVGWIKIPGTNINYPFVQHSDNSYYLNHSFDKTYNNAGWIFLDYRNNIDLLNTNSIIYAHGRVDGTMFGSLKNILSDKFDIEKNNVVKISTPYNNYIFEMFSIYHIPTSNDYLYVGFDDNKYSEFLDLISNRSMIDFNVDVDPNDKLITL